MLTRDGLIEGKHSLLRDIKRRRKLSCCGCSGSGDGGLASLHTVPPAPKAKCRPTIASPHVCTLRQCSDQCTLFCMENGDLTGHAILIVENEISWFVDKLQSAIDATGAQSMVIRGPERSVIDRIRHWKFSAAVINIEHAPDVGDLGIPLLVYGTTESAEAPAGRRRVASEVAEG